MSADINPVVRFLASLVDDAHNVLGPTFEVSLVVRSTKVPSAHFLIGKLIPETIRSTLDELESNGHSDHVATAAAGIIEDLDKPRSVS